MTTDAAYRTGDFPRGWTLQTSDDGTRWRTAASGTGSGHLTTIDLPRTTRARFLRVVSTASSGSWWSVADLRLYA